MSTDDLREYVKDRLSRYPAIDCALHFDLRRWLHDHPTSKSAPVLPAWVHDPATYGQHLRALGFGANEATVGAIGYDAGQKSRPLADPVDGIVIPRAEMPEVVVEGGGVISAAGWGQTTLTDPGYVRTQALALLALAEYLTAHPPVDAVSAKALSDRLTEAFDVENIDLPIAKIVGVARRLAARGVRVDLP